METWQQLAANRERHRGLKIRTYVSEPKRLTGKSLTAPGHRVELETALPTIAKGTLNGPDLSGCVKGASLSGERPLFRPAREAPDHGKSGGRCQMSNKDALAKEPTLWVSEP